MKPITFHQIWIEQFMSQKSWKFSGFRFIAFDRGLSLDLFQTVCHFPDFFRVSLGKDLKFIWVNFVSYRKLRFFETGCHQTWSFIFFGGTWQP